MPTIVAIRHGQCKYGEKGKAAGWKDPKLSDDGLMQAELLAPVLLGQFGPPDGTYSSDLRRASQTGKVVTKSLDLPPPIELPILRERKLGVATGQTAVRALELVPESARFFAATGVPYSESSDHGFETFTELPERMEPFVRYVDLSHDQDETVWVFTHGDAALGLASVCSGILMRRLVDKYYLKNTGYITMRPGSADLRITNPEDF